MRILTVHADFIEVTPVKRAIENAEKIKAKKTERYEEVLVVFTAVEERDEEVGGSAGALADEVESVARKVEAKRILLYPLVHLTSRPSGPKRAMEVIKKTEEILKDRGWETHHSPFGWYKSYTLRCKGHPLSELSREFTAREKEEVSESVKKEEKIKTRFVILDVDGEIYSVEKFNYGENENLRKFAIYETKKIRAYEKEPPHIKLMRSHSLVEYEPGSDPGNFRFLPKGKLIKKLLERSITETCIEYGAIEVETPIMYDFEHSALKKYLNRFPARQYIILSDKKKLFLRFAACFGQFLIAHDMVMSYKQLPVKMFELTHYSFRREQTGELAGLKRLRSFTMPDMHTFAADIAQAKREFEQQFDLGLKWLERIGIESEIGFRIQEDFFNENKEWYMRMVKKAGKPILLELFKERYAYFITKFEFNFIDSMGKASALTTVQIDVENAETYDINYIDKDGRKRRPLILHASISGSIERVIYALLEKEAMRIRKGGRGALPVWLSPTQIRLIPISDEQMEWTMEVLAQLKRRRVRVDVDDRHETLNKKIREAEREWIPFIAVIGEKEKEEKKLTVTIRKDKERKKMTIEDLIARVESENKGLPFEYLSLPEFLSKRPVI